MRAMCGVQLKEKKKSKKFILIFALNKTIVRLTTANSVHWYGDV